MVIKIKNAESGKLLHFPAVCVFFSLAVCVTNG